MNDPIKCLIKFYKKEQVKYVSHLDILRVFDRAMRRAHLPLGYSHGFNPHPLMTFAHPLGVGIASVGELAEFTMGQKVPEEEFQSQLNAVLPEGFSVEAVRYFEGKNNFASLAGAEYQIKLAGEFPDDSLTERFSLLPEMPMEKRTKSGVKETDIKPFVLRFEEKETGNFNVILKTGAVNLKPELFIAGLETYMPGLVIDSYAIVRICLLDDKLQPLEQFYKERS